MTQENQTTPVIEKKPVTSAEYFRDVVKKAQGLDKVPEESAEKTEEIEEEVKEDKKESKPVKKAVSKSSDTSTEEKEVGEESEVEGEADALRIQEDEGKKKGKKLEKVELTDNTPVKIKIDGQESVVTLADLKREYQIKEAANNRFREANEKMKRMEFLFNQAKGDPIGTALQMLIASTGDPRTAHEMMMQSAVKFLQPYIEENALTPDEKRIRQRERELNWREEEVKKTVQESEQRIQQQQIEKLQKEILATIDEELDKSGLAETYDKKILNKRVRDTIVSLDDLGIEVSIPEAVQKVKTKLESEARRWFSSLPPSEVKKINPKAFDQAKKERIEAAKESIRPTKEESENSNSTLSSRRSGEEMTTRDFFNRLERKAREGK